MAVMSVRRYATRSCRNAMTLIEIMSSILVLSIGLVGVLAAIPFGGFRLAQMNEADYSSSVGRVGVRLMKTNDWANPNNWYLKNNTTGAVFSSNLNSILVDGSNELTGLNLTYPFLIDPLANTAYSPVFYPNWTSSNVPPFFFTSVAPIIGTDNLVNALSMGLIDRYERAFYLPDDVASGYDLNEDDMEFRPRMEMEDDNVVGNGEIPAFTGRYSWMATVYPHSNTEPFYNCSLSDINSADFDVVVFKDRIIKDERVVSATIDGSGYQGGTVTLDLSTMKTSELQDCDGTDYVRMLEQLENTKFLALMGMDDVPVDGNYPYFCHWYRIANYSVVDENSNGDPLKIRVSLIGPNTPSSWTLGGGNANTVRALFFPGVVGVYSGSTTF